MKSASVRILLITFLPSVIILTFVIAAGAFAGITMNLLTRDVASIARIHPLSGILSNLGIQLWCVSASVCAFVAATIRGKAPRGISLFLLVSALLSAWLLFDDLFLFHENLAKRYFGLSERVVICGLGMSVAAYLAAFRKTILKTDSLLLIVALGFLSSSAFIDFALGKWIVRCGQWGFIIEDGLKWVGISCWCGYYLTAAHKFLSDAYVVSKNENAGQITS